MRLIRYNTLLTTTALVLSVAPAFASISATPFPIHWTAPGDDGLIGRAAVYDLRYSINPITAANFAQATGIAGLPAPSVAGFQESFVVLGLADGVLHYLAMKSADEAGNWSAMSNVITRPVPTTDADPSALAFSFSSPMPNPARGTVRWTYSLPQAAEVQVDVFDVVGRLVHTVASGGRGAGSGDMSWDLRDDQGFVVGAGIYFVKARLGALEWTKRLVVVR